jgi:hypothetical protein
VKPGNDGFSSQLKKKRAEHRGTEYTEREKASDRGGLAVHGQGRA